MILYIYVENDKDMQISVAFVCIEMYTQSDNRYIP